MKSIINNNDIMRFKRASKLFLLGSFPIYYVLSLYDWMRYYAIGNSFFREMKGNNWLFLTNFFKEKSIPIIKVLGMQRVRKQNIGI